MRGPVYLVASGQNGLLPQVARRAYEALGKKGARVAVSYAPVAGDARGLKFMSARTADLFPDATIERFAVDGEQGGANDRARAIVERADLVFVSGGDPTLGAKVLDKSGASGWMREAQARGVPHLGVSAGAILLGSWWADWPEEDDAEPMSVTTQVEHTDLVPCVGVVPRHVFDTHNERDDWDELRIVAKLCSRRKQKAQFLGIPTRGALVFDEQGAMEVVGEPPFHLS
jgi:cyanophycinase-like exopeptidase